MMAHAFNLCAGEACVSRFEFEANLVYISQGCSSVVECLPRMQGTLGRRERKTQKGVRGHFYLGQKELEHSA